MATLFLDYLKTIQAINTNQADAYRLLTGIYFLDHTPRERRDIPGGACDVTTTYSDALIVNGELCAALRAVYKFGRVVVRPSTHLGRLFAINTLLATNDLRPLPTDKGYDPSMLTTPHLLAALIRIENPGLDIVA